MSRTLYTVCPHNCPDTCGLQVNVSKGKVVAVTGQKDHPVTKGFICEKVRHYPEKVHSYERIRKPLKRVGDKGKNEFIEISWDEALYEISTKLKETHERYGGRSILPYSYSGTIGVIQNASMDRRFFNRLNTSIIDRTICSAAGNAAFTYTMGDQVGLDPEDTKDSAYIIIWGTNTILTNIHQWMYIEEARKKGAKLVVIDIERTETAQKADWFIQLLPGTDAALALGLIHVLMDEGLIDEAFIEEQTIGIDELTYRAKEYTPEYVEQVTGIPAAHIRKLAREYGSSKASFIRIGNGQQHHIGGGMSTRAILYLPALTGAWQYPGGGAIYFNLLQGKVDRTELEQPDLRTEKAMVVNMNLLGEALLEKADPIRLLFVYNSNPASVTPDQTAILKGLGREDLVTIVHEQTMTETAKYADYVLPATTAMEHTDLYKSYWHRYWQVGRPVISPIGEALSNTELFRRLARACGFTETCFKDTDEELMRQAVSSKPSEWKNDLFSGRVMKWDPEDREREEVEPWVKGTYSTPSGKIEFYSDKMKEVGLDPLPHYATVKPKKDHLWLITSPHRRGLNSQFLYQFYPEKEKPFAIIHPDISKRYQLTEGDWIVLYNNKGEIKVKVKIDQKVFPSAIIVRGIWPFKAFQGKNMNSLTSSQLSDFGGGATFFTTFVQLRKVDN
ncbi:molybdopterin-dependent oxidoreductase [Alkalihalophilus lindianensis]|uniref:Molybdopterin-dependent oxidoreductase n=1 Tax=Alkalihalophilus lindianensis TaxID=1630542 RepID=A0ABU3XB06_9BACI|nr:molybdopterin-dependent oxidoreductase [Alkalihalophilus lindianensis]